ncbi:dickkopf-related protein 2-like isoform X1 [Takifugu rubripes]|uniref:dickkopf-related protein 2-like isoform X1 n=1 Tax=Takifugu rubripes TaxID=31033 RepID=UPI001145B150|nr:dickkopf-related protein 2-like isoform X1 [Takifugu rubripes]
MSLQAVAVSVSLVLLVWSCPAHTRAWTNTIRTVILQEEQAPLVNRSLWEPGLDIMVSVHQCISDLECAEGSYCHAPTRGSAYARCQMCRRRRRRCHRDGMCCPGNHCSRNVCSPESAISPDLDGGTSPRRGGRRTDVRAPAGRVGDGCLGSGRCSAGLCCARHFWTHICKPVLQEGQVCTRRRHGGRRPLELFQRCPCAHGLGCRTLRESGVRSSSELKSKVKRSPARHAPPHTSAGKTRLHVCQRS